MAVMVVWFATRERVFYGRVSRRRLHPARHYAAVAIRTMPLVGHTGSRARDRFRFSPSEATHPDLPGLRLCGICVSQALPIVMRVHCTLPPLHSLF